jgi:hypothetical protein
LCGTVAEEESDMTQQQLASELLAHGLSAELAYAILADEEEWEEEDILALLEDETGQ